MNQAPLSVHIRHVGNYRMKHSYPPFLAKENKKVESVSAQKHVLFICMCANDNVMKYDESSRAEQPWLESQQEHEKYRERRSSLLPSSKNNNKSEGDS